MNSHNPHTTIAALSADIETLNGDLEQLDQHLKRLTLLRDNKTKMRSALLSNRQRLHDILYPPTVDDLGRAKAIANESALRNHLKETK